MAMTEAYGSWTGNWVAEKLQSHREVVSTSLVTPNHVHVSRVEHEPILVGATAASRLDAPILRSVIDNHHDVGFVVNIPKESYIAGDAIALSSQRSIPVGGMGDLMRAISLFDVSSYVSPESKFVERGIAQHDRVRDYEQLADRLYRIERNGLVDVRVAFLNEYELTADHIRTARSRYGTFRMAVITNPNGKATSAAEAAAQSMGCQVYKWGPFLGALNRA